MDCEQETPEQLLFPADRERGGPIFTAVECCFVNGGALVVAGSCCANKVVFDVTTLVVALIVGVVGSDCSESVLSCVKMTSRGKTSDLDVIFVSVS